MYRSRSTLAFFSPVVDTLLAFFIVWTSPEITNLIAENYDGWEPGTDFNFFFITPFIAGAAVMAVPLVLRLVGFYLRGNLQRTSTAVRQLFIFTVYYLCAIAFYQLLRPGAGALYMNRVILVNVVCIPVALFLRYGLFRWLQVCLLSNSKNLRQVLLVGTEEDIETGWAKIPRYWKSSLNAVGKVITGKTSPEDAQKLIEENHVEQIFLFGGMPVYGANKDFITTCELQGLDIYIMLRNDHVVNLRAHISELQDTRMLILSATPVYSLAQMIKGIMGRLLALIGIILSSPLWLITAIGIKISDPNGKVFYRQARSGLYGKPFMMWKFRSMYSDADKRLDEVKAKYGNEMDGPIFKLTNDPRIFPFGRFIRKFSIDELPQLINILMGDMSVVGPRPLPVYETKDLPKIEHRRRMSVRPGLTCFWQVEGRSDDGDFDSMISKDLKYIDNWSLWLDIVLILRTIPAVLFGKGAK